MRIRELAASINENGLMEPLLVRRLSARRYEVLDGAYRLAAVRKLGWKTVEIMVLPHYRIGDSYAQPSDTLDYVLGQTTEPQLVTYVPAAHAKVAVSGLAEPVR